MKLALREVVTGTLAAFAPTTATVMIRESVGDLSDYADPDIGLSATQGGSYYFRRLTQSRADLAPLTHERMQEIALSLYDRNPLAKRCLELIKDFVVGEGFAPTAKDDKVQAMITRFWNDGQNAMGARMHTFALELGLWGEQAFAAFVNEQSGHVRLVSIDPRTIKSALPDPTNPDLPLAISVASDQGPDARYLKVIREDEEGRLVGAAPDELLKLDTGAVPYWNPAPPETQTRLVGVFFWAVNKVQGATRGRSDLLSVADFLDLYDRLIFDEAERMSFLRAFVYDVTVKGAQASDLIAKAANEPPPKPGSVKYHNESEEWKAVSPSLNAQDGATTADLILSLIATGVGLPKLWLNGSMDLNKATAFESGEPSLKRLRARQQIVLSAVERMVRFALDQAELAGALPASDEGRHPFQVSVPEMSQRDAEKAARALFAFVQAIGMADAANWIDSETARQGVVMMLGQLGINVDLAELKERLAAEAQARSDADDYQIPSLFGVGSEPGKDEITKAISGDGNQSGGAGEGTGARGAASPLAATDGMTWANVLDKVSGSLVELGNAGVIDGQFAQEVVAKLFALAGITVDIEAMQGRIDAEAEASQAEQVPPELAGDPNADPLADMNLPDTLVAEAWRDVLGTGDEALIEAVADGWEESAYLLAEAFDAAQHPRAAGGRFGTKAPVTDEFSPPDAKLAAQIQKILSAGQKKAKGKASPKGRAAAKGKATPKGKAGGAKGKASAKTKSLSRGELSQQIRGLVQGSAITITLANGKSVSGTVERSAGGVAIVKTASGDIILHGGLKNVAKIEG